MPELAPDDIDERETARLVKCAVSPRPIAWVSTRSESGVDNLAPFSSCTYIGSTKPVLQFNSSRRANGERKDSARNAVETGEFAVNVVTAAHLEAMDRTSEAVPHGESEFDLAGVERAPCVRIDAPRVADAMVTMECRIYDTLEVHERLVVLGEVCYYHVDESAIVDGEVDARRFDTVGRLGGPYYTVSEPLEFQRQY